MATAVKMEYIGTQPDNVSMVFVFGIFKKSIVIC